MHSHTNGFLPLELPLEELEKVFELGHKYEERESNDPHIDPRTGIKAFAEPFLALYISVSVLASGDIPITLNYARTRSRFPKNFPATDEHQRLLLHAARSSIISDLQMMTKNQLPESAKKFKGV